jgi:hypothetical protein
MPASARRRGAPTGNRNALKHGYYSRTFHRKEVTELSTSEFTGLAEEIGVIRLLTKRILKQAQAEDLDLFENLEILRALALAVTCINRLVRTQVMLYSDENGMEELLSRALQEIHEEFEKGNYNLDLTAAELSEASCVLNEAPPSEAMSNR